MRTLILCFTGLVALVGSSSVKRFDHSFESLVPPPYALKHLVLGYNLTAADVLWVRLLQDFDQCGAGFTERSVIVKIDMQKIKSEEMPKNDPGMARCKEGWGFQMLDAITTLDPRFYSAHRYGGAVLSIAVDDDEGARQIYDRALAQFPDDLAINYEAAYHYMAEIGNPSRAAQLLVRAGELGAPAWVFSLAAKLYSQDGQDEFALSVLRNSFKSYGSEDERWKARIEQRIKEIEDRMRERASKKN